MTKNLYEDLDITDSSEENDIKKAYRKQSIKYHPDRNKSKDDSSFKKAQEAYNILKD
jgi:DnaJ-class molecular chaperone